MDSIDRMNAVCEYLKSKGFPTTAFLPALTKNGFVCIFDADVSELVTKEVKDHLSRRNFIIKYKIIEKQTNHDH